MLSSCSTTDLSTGDRLPAESSLSSSLSEYYKKNQSIFYKSKAGNIFVYSQTGSVVISKLQGKGWFLTHHQHHLLHYNHVRLLKSCQT